MQPIVGQNAAIGSNDMSHLATPLRGELDMQIPNQSVEGMLAAAVVNGDNNAAAFEALAAAAYEAAK
jgi:hypothetical protein